MLKRILVAIPIIVIVALAFLIQSWVLAVFAVIVALMSQFEVVRALDENKKPVVKSISFLFAGMMAILFLFEFAIRPVFMGFMPSGFTPATVLVLFVICTMAAFVIAMFSKKHTAQSVGDTVLTMVYPQMFFVLFYALILTATYPRFVTDWVSASLAIEPYYGMLILLLLIFLPAMFSDTFAYFFGMALGKRKLCPAISPKKTVVGCVAGIAGGVVAALIIWLVFDNMIYINGHYLSAMAPLASYMIAGAVLAGVSQLGDLSASYLKRALNIKDFGKLLPGHGGVVDRMDSIIFCIPVVFLLSMMGII